MFAPFLLCFPTAPRPLEQAQSSHEAPQNEIRSCYLQYFKYCYAFWNLLFMFAPFLFCFSLAPRSLEQARRQVMKLHRTKFVLVIYNISNIATPLECYFYVCSIFILLSSGATTPGAGTCKSRSVNL